jgi:glycerophosphoryl diester phosphodiesterase
MGRIIFAVIASFLSTLLSQAADSQTTFDLQAHRGGRDARPENTLISFAYAMELGVTTLEMDLQLTADGQLVVSHNPILSPILTKDDAGKYVESDRYDLRTMNLSEVKKFDVGVMNPAAGEYRELHGKTQLSVPKTRIPTLEEVFDLVREYQNDSVRFNIETKSYPDPLDPVHLHSPDPVVFVRAIDQVVRKYGLQKRVTLQSFDWRTLEAMHALDPEIALVALSAEQPSWGRVEGCYLRLADVQPSPWLGGLNIHDFQGDFVRAAKAIGATCVSPYWEELSPQLIKEAHSLGMTVIPWTVNNPHDMALLIDMGVDGLITDRPWVLRQVLQQRGMALPPPVSHPSSAYFTGIAIQSAETTIGKPGADAAH